MNTQNEIQTLRHEVDTFRDENIALYNELVKQNKILCEQIFTLRAQNDVLQKLVGKQQATLEQALAELSNLKISQSRSLGNYITRIAAMEAAQFVTENLLEVKSFKNRPQDGFCASEEYLQYVLSQTENFIEGGLFLEFGVFYGRSIIFTSRAKPDKIIYGFDSFEGLPESFRDLPKGKFSMHGNMPNVPANVRLIKGWFDETLPEFVKAHPEPCAFIHVDCDCYSSTKTIFDNLKNQIISGTVIAFDEYFNYPGWKKYEYKAFMELVEEKNIEFEYIARTDYEQVAVKIK